MLIRKIFAGARNTRASCFYASEVKIFAGARFARASILLWRPRLCAEVNVWTLHTTYQKFSLALATLAPSLSLRSLYIGAPLYRNFAADGKMLSDHSARSSFLVPRSSIFDLRIRRICTNILKITILYSFKILRHFFFADIGPPGVGTYPES